MTDHDHDERCEYMGREALEHRVMNDIARVGWHCTGVLGNDQSPPYAYTVGLHETHGHPELVLCGINPDHAHGLIWAAVRLIEDGEVFAADDESENIAQGFPVRFEAVSEEALLGCFGVSNNYYGEPVPRLQIVWPDPEGRFPGEGCNERMARIQDLALTLTS